MLRLGTVSLFTSALLVAAAVPALCQDQQPDAKRKPVDVKYDTDENVISAEGKARFDLDKVGGAMERWWQSWWEEEKHGPRDTTAGAARGVRAFIRHYDENDDGEVSRRELPESLRDDFDYVDRDENGTLSAAELREYGTKVYNVKNKRDQAGAGDEPDQKHTSNASERIRVDERDRTRVDDAPDRIRIDDKDRTGRKASGTRLRTEVTIDEDPARDSADQTWSEWWDSWFEEDESTQASASGARELLRRHDANDDDVLTRNEVSVRMRTDFARIDTNDDGQLTRAEIVAHADTLNIQTTRRQDDFQMADLWSFGEDREKGPAINKSFQQMYRLLAKLDDDNDGELSDEELGESARNVISEWASRCFQRLDQDDDGQLSRQEAQGSLLKGYFDRMDQNGDSALSQSEVQRGLRETLAAGVDSAERQ